MKINNIIIYWSLVLSVCALIYLAITADKLEKDLILANEKLKQWEEIRTEIIQRADMGIKEVQIASINPDSLHYEFVFFYNGRLKNASTYFVRRLKIPLYIK